MTLKVAPNTSPRIHEVGSLATPSSIKRATPADVEMPIGPSQSTPRRAWFMPTMMGTLVLAVLGPILGCSTGTQTDRSVPAPSTSLSEGQQAEQQLQQLRPQRQQYRQQLQQQMQQLTQQGQQLDQQGQQLDQQGLRQDHPARAVLAEQRVDLAEEVEMLRRRIARARN